MNKKLMTDYSFLERCRGIEKKLLIVTDDDEKKKLMMALNKMKKNISQEAYDLERKVKYLEDKIEELKKLKGLPKANRSDINAKIKKHEEEIFGLTHI